MVKMRFLFAFALIILAQCTMHNAHCVLFAQDKIVAIVNNEVITQKDLDDFLNFMRMQYAQELKGRELENKIQSMKIVLLDKLIEDRLMLQDAQKTLNEANTKKDPYT